MNKTHFPIIQANILKGHGRNNAWYIFLKLNRNGNILEWLKRYVIPTITSFKNQVDASIRRKKNPSYDAGMLFSFFISNTGFTKLGIPKEHQPNDDFFLSGMKSTIKEFNDPPLDKWEKNYCQDLDAMILLADNSIENINAKQIEIINSLHQFNGGVVLFTEIGKVIKSNGTNIEHFGFADGISQPEFFKLTGKKKGVAWKTALINTNPIYNFGSYLVFRKLEQNVKVFNEEIKRLESKVQHPNPRKFVEAQVIGRFKNGMPLTLGGDEWPDKFKFDKNTDKNGHKCPFHAHIRKINPREGEYRDIQITRRGITYGIRKPDLSDQPKEGVGLLFNCYQRSIKNQFGVIQKRCNSSQYINNKHRGRDPIIGQIKIDDRNYKQKWNISWEHPGTFSHSFKKVVTMKGGEYFFAPSINYLENL